MRGRIAASSGRESTFGQGNWPKVPSYIEQRWGSAARGVRVRCLLVWAVLASGSAAVVTAGGSLARCPLVVGCRLVLRRRLAVGRRFGRGVVRFGRLARRTRRVLGRGDAREPEYESGDAAGSEQSDRRTSEPAPSRVRFRTGRGLHVISFPVAHSARPRLHCVRGAWQSPGSDLCAGWELRTARQVHREGGAARFAGHLDDSVM